MHIPNRPIVENREGVIASRVAMADPRPGGVSRAHLKGVSPVEIAISRTGRKLPDVNDVAS